MRQTVLNLEESKIREVANAGMGRADVLPFWFGESDEATPDAVRDAAIASLQSGETFYSHNLGLPALRDAVAAYSTGLHGPYGHAVSADRIAITSPAVFSGYRLDPAATAAALTGRTLRTNDRGRWSGGRLQVLGRVDDVVITGGVNVDLAAAQRVADAAFGPARLALLAVPDERWGVRIVALTDAAIELAECRSRLADSLQPAAVPRDLRRVAGLPRTSTGKIDRTGLLRLWAEGG